MRSKKLLYYIDGKYFVIFLFYNINVDMTEKKVIIFNL